MVVGGGDFHKVEGPEFQFLCGLGVLFTLGQGNSHKSTLINVDKIRLDKGSLSLDVT